MNGVLSGFRSDTRRQLLLYGIAFGCFFQQSVLFPVLPRFASELGLSVALVGAVLSARFLVPAMIAAQIGAWTSRLGLRRSLIGAGLAMTGAAALYLLSDNVAMLLIAQIVNGVLYLFAWIAAQTYATRMPNRDFVLGIFATTTAIGMAVAPILGGIALDLGGYDWAFGLYGIGALALTINAIALGDAAIGRPMPPKTRRGSGRTRELLARPGLQAAFLFSFLCLFTISLRGNVVPIYLEDIGYSASLVGVVLGAGSLGQAAVRPFTHLLLRSFSLSATMILAVAFAIAGLAVMPFLPVTGVLLVLAFLHGGGAGLHQSLGLVLVAEGTSDDERGYAVGLRATINQIAVAIAPVAAGIVAALAGLGPMLVVLSAGLALTIPFLRRVLHRADASRNANRAGASGAA